MSFSVVGAVDMELRHKLTERDDDYWNSSHLVDWDIDILRSFGEARRSGTVIAPALKHEYRRLSWPNESSEINVGQCHQNVRNVVAASDEYTAIYGVAQLVDCQIVHSWLEHKETGEWFDPSIRALGMSNNESFDLIPEPVNHPTYYVGLPSPLVYGDSGGGPSDEWRAELRDWEQRRERRS